MTASDSEEDDNIHIPRETFDDSMMDSNHHSSTESNSSCSESEDSESLPKESICYDGEDQSDVPEGVYHVHVESPVKRIKMKAFQLCRNLRIVDLNEGLQVIGKDSFNNCECLDEINIPSTVWDIKRGSFYRCTNLLEVQLPHGLKVIGARAFSGCENLMRIKIPSGVKTIRTGAFNDCLALSTVTLSEGLEVIGPLAFESCESLKSVLLPSTVTVIGDRAFQSCTSLMRVTTNNGLRVIENCAFRGCFSLTTITIPDTVRMIEPYAFCWCDNLISIEFSPKGSLLIGAALLHGCESLRSIFIEPHVRTPHGADIFQSPDQNLDSPPNPLQQVFPGNDDNHSILLQGMKRRFHLLPVHETCYYQAHRSTTTTVALLQAAMKKGKEVTNGDLDVFKMSPFHVLALSSNPDFSLFQLLLKRYPLDFACQEDIWGYTPLDYLVWNQTSCKQTKQQMFLLTVIDRGNRCCNHPQWQEDIKRKVHSLVRYLRQLGTKPAAYQAKHFGAMYATLAKYEKMEAISLVELALWKMRLDYDLSPLPSTLRQDCRFICGASIVIPGVLAFLGKAA